MKKILLSFMAMALLATSANAQVINKEVKESAKVELNNKFTAAAKVKAGPKRLKDNQKIIGYAGSLCNDGVGFTGFDKWVSANMIVSVYNNSAILDQVRGYKIVGLNFAVMSSLGDKAQVFATMYNGDDDQEGADVSTTLTTYENSVQSKDGKTIDVKWNEVMFDKPYTITDELTEIWYGYSYTQMPGEEPVLFGVEKESTDYKNMFLVGGIPSAGKKEGFYYVSSERQNFVPCFQLIVESSNGETAILGVDGTLQPVPSKYYTLDGKQLSAPQKGLNLVKMSDGTTRKVVK